MMISDLTDIEVLSDQKKSLLAYKESILDQINICDKRIDGVRQNQDQLYSADEDSSDSDCDIPVPLAVGPLLTQLQAQELLLKVCLQATIELTNLQVLEFEIDVLVDPPEIKYGVAPVEEGLWRAVAAECRVDLIPFSITFHVHQPSLKFSCPTYHNLTVAAAKKAHETELAPSVLAEVRTPSDAVQIIHSYARAHRSRRTTLARLADQYADNLFMEALPEGGYLLKCANMEMSWSLQNKWSPIAPFHHRMKFDVDYIGDEYIKQIKHAHKQVIDPAADTKDRTYNLATIIDICLETAGALPNIEESDTDTDKMNKTRTTLDQEPEMPAIRRNEATDIPVIMSNDVIGRKKDSQVMAPPKGLPKKAKGKENVSKVDEGKSFKKAEDGKKGGDEKVETGELKNSVNNVKANKVEVKTNVAKVVKKSTNADKIQKPKVNNEDEKAIAVDKSAPKKRPSETVADLNTKKAKTNKIMGVTEKSNIPSKVKNVAPPTAERKIVTKKDDKVVKKVTDKIISGNVAATTVSDKTQNIKNKNALINNKKSSTERNVAATRISDKIQLIKPKDNLIKANKLNTDRDKVIKTVITVANTKNEQNKVNKNTKKLIKPKETIKNDKVTGEHTNKENVSVQKTTKIPTKVVQNVQKKLKNLDKKPGLAGVKSKIPQQVVSLKTTSKAKLTTQILRKSFNKV